MDGSDNTQVPESDLSKDELRARVAAARDNIKELQEELRSEKARGKKEELERALHRLLVEYGCSKPDIVARMHIDDFQLDEESGELQVTPGAGDSLIADVHVGRIKGELPELFLEESPKGGFHGDSSTSKYDKWRSELSRIR